MPGQKPGAKSSTGRGLPDCQRRRVAQALRRFSFFSLTTLPSESVARLDKWLWAVRLFKTRSLATDACRAGSVSINNHAAKPAREVRPGETVVVRQGLINRILRVLDVPRSRVGANLVARFCDELTPPEEFAKARENRLQHLLEREKGRGRPTKRDRRLLDRLLG
jgi:ribosome-associated heat shock protein Hsp15